MNRWTLRSRWEPGSGNGELTLTLALTGDGAPGDVTLCYTGQLQPETTASVRGATRVRFDGGYHEMLLDPPARVPDGLAWTLGLTDLFFAPSHANDGPVSAWVLVDGGEPERVDVAPMAGPSGASAKARDDRASTIAPAAADDVRPGVLPYPNEVRMAGAAAPPGSLALAPGCTADAVEQGRAAESTRALLFPDEPLVLHTASVPTDALVVRVATLDGAPGSYAIHFDEDAVRIEAPDGTGTFHAFVTLLQMVRAAHVGTRNQDVSAAWPAAGSSIVDAPAHAWRGAMLDVARRFRPVEDVERFVAALAWFKLNRFHWHLTDDEGWRLEVRAYPALVDGGARRGRGHAVPSQLGDGPDGHAGHYSHADVARVVAFAAARHVEIVPEVDLPGHSTAALRALPWLADPDEAPDGYVAVQRFRDNALNPARPEAMRFALAVIDEVIDLFPGDVVHVGGDEVSPQAWHRSPVARALARELGLPDTAALQHRFTGALQRRVVERGRTVGVWDDAAGPGLDPERALVFAWRGAEHAARLGALGYDVVLKPAQTHYLDMARSPDWHEPGAGWAGHASAADTYGFDADAAGVPAAQLRGVQCALFCEHVANAAVLNRLVFPRLVAVAEGGWTRAANRSWPRFDAMTSGASFEALLPRL